MTPWTVAHQAPLSMGVPRKNIRVGSFPSPGDLPNPGIKPRSPGLQADSLLSEPSGKCIHIYTHTYSVVYTYTTLVYSIVYIYSVCVYIYIYILYLHCSQISSFLIHTLAEIYFKPQINTCGIFVVICRHTQAQSSKKCSVLALTFPLEIEQSNILPSCFSSHTISKCSFHSLFSTTVFPFLCFC